MEYLNSYPYYYNSPDDVLSDLPTKKGFYVWIKEPLESMSVDGFTTEHLANDVKKISWEMPIVPVEDVEKFMKENPNILEDEGLDVAIAEPDNPTDKSFYAIYLSNWKGKEIDLGYPQDPEQLIKMKFPKKLQNDILKKSIRLTELKPPIEDQTQRLFT